MTLRWKFIALLAVLGLAVAMNLVVSAWSIVLLERELARPLASVQRVMSQLSLVKRAVGEQHNALAGEADLAAIGPERPNTEDPGRAGGPEQHVGEDALRAAEMRARIAGEALEALGSQRSAPMLMGTGTLANLRQRVARAFELGLDWLRTEDEEARRESMETLFGLHELIERVEARILESAGEEISFADDLRGRLALIIGVTVLAAIGCGLYALWLVNRWVLRPVGELRKAAGAIAAGDFEHRVRIVGDDEIAQLGVEVNHMAGMVDRMQRERIERERLAAMGEMTRRIVHNLRNPLSGIRSLAEVTRSELASMQGASPDMVEGQDRIIRTVDRFEGWLAGLLRATSPKTLEPDWHQPGAIVRSVTETLRLSAQGAGVGLVVDEASALAKPCWIDAGHIEHALVALVSNAIEASPRGGSVRVGVRSVAGGERGAGRVVFWVQDQGPGVPESVGERVFEPTFTTKPTGTGIGLAVVRQVAQLHGGSARLVRRQAEASPGRGRSEGRPGSSVHETGQAQPAESGRGALFEIDLPVGGPEHVATSGRNGTTRGEDSGH